MNERGREGRKVIKQQSPDSLEADMCQTVLSLSSIISFNPIQCDTRTISNPTLQMRKWRQKCEVANSNLCSW